MTGALATCDWCGHIDLGTITAVTVRHCEDNGAMDYRFRCPICARTNVRLLWCGVAHQLIQAGARVEHWRLPREIFERPGHDAPSIAVDDLIDFHFALERLPTAGYA